MQDKIIGLYTGTPKPLGERISAIRKDKVETLTVHMNSIDGDECEDKKHHGGSKRVIHHYSLKNYDRLKKTFPKLAEKFKAGSYGENICTENFEEKDLCIGDIFQIGEVTGRLTTPRFPCSTIDATYEHQGILKEILNTGHYGWFYEIITPGIIKSSDHVELLERPHPTFNLHELILQCGRKSPSDKEILARMQTSGILDETWEKKIQRVL